MSTDAWIEKHWIGEAVLPRPRRAPKLPALSVPHAPTCSRGNAALAAHAQSRDSARHPGDGLSARQDGQNVVDQQARKLTQPVKTALEETRMLILGAQIGWRCPIADDRHRRAADRTRNISPLRRGQCRYRPISPAHFANGLLLIAAFRAQSRRCPFHHRGSNRRPAGRDNCWLLLSLSWAELLVRAAILAQPSNRSQ